MNAPVLIVVGAGPAGRALAHRAGAAGLRVTLVDPAPDRPWHATYGMFSDDVPPWLDDAAAAARTDETVVYTPARRRLARGYTVFDPVRLQRALSLDSVTVVAAAAASITATAVTLPDGTVLTADCVVDARGSAGRRDDRLPRQSAFGVFDSSPDRDGEAGEAVLMDWRPAVGDAAGAPSFSYRVPTARGRLVEETCLAARPPLAIAELERRARARHPAAETADTDVADTHTADVEIVDFPLLDRPCPWRKAGPDEALRFGAAGGLMNPATGYSVAQSLAAVDVVVAAVAAGDDPRRALWPLRARLTYRLQLIGLSVLLGLSADDLVRFFDAFFRLSVRRQRAYLSARDDAGGVLAAMAAVFVRCPVRLQVRVATRTAAALRPGRCP